MAAASEITIPIKFDNPVQFVVRRKNGQFILSCDQLRDNRSHPMVTVPTAQMIMNYCNACFVPGTTIHWEIYATD